jgi:hypothetical protein
VEDLCPNLAERGLLKRGDLGLVKPWRAKL